MSSNFPIRNGQHWVPYSGAPQFYTGVTLLQLCSINQGLITGEVVEKLEKIYVETEKFKLCDPKKSGCEIGSMFQKTSSKTPSKITLWLGKAGEKGEKIKDPELSKNTTSQKEMNLSAILEKIASDFYQLFSCGFFEVPKTRLSEQILFDQFVPTDGMPWDKYKLKHDEEYNKKYPSSCRFMSRWMNEYRDFAHARVWDKQKAKDISFMEFIREYRCPPTELYINGKSVPLSGLMEILAVGRVLADTDVLGGGGKNAGFIEIREAGQVTGARAVKIDPGCSFRFSCPGEFSNPGDDWGVSKNLRIANSPDAPTLLWKELTPFQKEEFLSIFFNASHYLKMPRFLEYLFFRENRFCRNDVCSMPEKTAQEYQQKMIKWMYFQCTTYWKDIENLHQKQLTESLKRHCLQLFQEPIYTPVDGKEKKSKEVISVPQNISPGTISLSGSVNWQVQLEPSWQKMSEEVCFLVKLNNNCFAIATIEQETKRTSKRVATVIDSLGQEIKIIPAGSFAKKKKPNILFQCMDAEGFLAGSTLWDYKENTRTLNWLKTDQKYVRLRDRTFLSKNSDFFEGDFLKIYKENGSVQEIKGLNGREFAISVFLELQDGMIAVGCAPLPGNSHHIPIKLISSQGMPMTLELRGHTGAINTIIELRDGTLASGSSDGTIKLWDLKQKQEWCKCEFNAKEPKGIFALAELQDGTIASGSGDGAISFWNRLDGSCFHAIRQAHQFIEPAILKLIELEDGVLVSQSKNEVKLWKFPKEGSQ